VANRPRCISRRYSCDENDVKLAVSSNALRLDECGAWRPLPSPMITELNILLLMLDQSANVSLSSATPAAMFTPV
jgi:hypothetical protein